MIGRRCHCGCRARLDTLNVRSHAKYASRACKTRAWRSRHPEASRMASQSQTRLVSGESLTKRAAFYTRTHDLSPTGREQTLDKRLFSFIGTPQEEFVRFRGDSMDVEQQARRIEALEAELERIRAAATEDLQNWTAKYTALMRENTTLQNKLVKQEEDKPEHDDVKDILVAWKDATARSNKADIGAGSKRYAIAQAAHKRWGKERCLHAIRGLGLQPWAGPRGRSASEYAGAKKYADVEHALGDEVRMEKLEAIWLAHERPSLLDQPTEPDREPESRARQFVRYAYGEDCTLPYVPASKEPKQTMTWPDPPPIDKVLGALHARHLRVVVYDGKPDSWSAQCPAHDDRNPSLSIHRRHDGVIGLHCWAGCPTENVVASLGLEWGDLWEDSERDRNRADGPPLPRPMPDHLQQAMRDLLARSERLAA